MTCQWHVRAARVGFPEMSVANFGGSHEPRSVAKPKYSRLCVVATRIKSSCPHQKQRGDAKHLLFVFIAAGGNAEALQEASDIQNKEAIGASCCPALCAGHFMSSCPRIFIKIKMQIYKTLLTRYFGHVILGLQTYMREGFNEKIYCLFTLHYNHNIIDFV